MELHSALPQDNTKQGVLGVDREVDRGWSQLPKISRKVLYRENGKEKMETTISFRCNIGDYIGIMEKKMETTIL